MATNPRQTEKESHEAAHDVTRKAGEQTAQASRSMTDTGERFASAGIEAGRRNAQGLTSTWRSGSEAASRIAERSMDQLSTMFGMTGDSARQALTHSSGNLQAVMESMTIIADGYQRVSGEWIQFVQGSIEQNLNHLEHYQGCRSLQELMALQTQIARDNLESLLQTLSRASEHSMKVAEEAARTVSASTLAPR